MSSSFDKQALLVYQATHHFVVDFVEMDLTDFVNHVLALKRDEAKAWNRKNRCRLIIENERCFAMNCTIQQCKVNWITVSVNSSVSLEIHLFEPAISHFT